MVTITSFNPLDDRSLDLARTDSGYRMTVYDGNRRLAGWQDLILGSWEVEAVFDGEVRRIGELELRGEHSLIAMFWRGVLGTVPRENFMSELVKAELEYGPEEVRLSA